MALDKQPDQTSTFSTFRFLGGAALGALMVTVPYSVPSIPLDSIHVGLSAFAILLCGVLAEKFGSTFIETLSKMLADTGLY